MTVTMRARQRVDGKGKGGARGKGQCLARGEKVLGTCYVRDGSLQTPRAWICGLSCVGASIPGS